jgi:hypothetical protein
MEHNTSVGPAESAADEKRETRATTEGVDAQNANEFDIENGLAGIEAKPFSPANPDQKARDVSAADKDDVRRPAEEGLVSERRTPARDDGVNTASSTGDPDPSS